MLPSLTNECLEHERTSLQTELDTFRATSSTSTEEAEGLRAQVSKLESSKREAIVLLDNKSTAHDKLADELSESQLKVVSLRQELANLGEKQQEAVNNLNNAKILESSLQQEIEILKRNNDWLDGELKAKTAEFSKFRKDRNTRVAELQRLHEDASNNINSLKRTENQLRSRITEMERKSEDHLNRIQRMQDEALRKEDDFRAELESSRRLAQLQEQSAQTARKRVEELDDEIEKTRQDAMEEVSQVQSELETERQERGAAEQKAEELELQVERLEANVGRIEVASPSAGSPNQRPNGAGPFGTPLRGSSPAPGTSTPSSRMRGNLSMTQLYSDLSKNRSELAESKRQNGKLREEMDRMMKDLEAKVPELQDLHENNARLESDIAGLSSSFNHVQQERDALKKDSRKWQGQTSALTREGDILRQQLRDLSTQVKVLTVEVQIRTEGVELSTAERQALQRAASGESDEQIFEGMTDSGKFISQRLATFRNVFELQEQNTKLLKLTRELGEEMEGEEAKAKRSQQEKDQEELVSLRDQLEQIKDKLATSIRHAESYVKERDMYRRMLAHRGQIPRDADMESMFGETINGLVTPSRNPLNGASQGSPGAQDHAQESRLLKEIQSHFDAYKREAATDHSTLREQINSLSKDKGTLQGDLARARSQVTMAQERYEMLQANYNLLKTECEELQKRSQYHAETAAKQDSRIQTVAEDLVEARELADGLRSENANLKAEKELWKRIEARINEENRSLSDERGRLNSLLTNNQRLSGEREASDAEQRRRVQSQFDSLEKELKTTKTKLDEEVEAGKNAALRREYDSEQNRTRIDDLMKSLGSTKEELTAAKTLRDQLQARVEELKIELRTAQQHAQALQPRPTPRVGTESEATRQSETLSREQGLSIEVADLQRELGHTRTELERAREQVEQFKSISQASEDALQNFEESSDDYRQRTDKDAAEKDAKIRDLEQRRDEISEELSTTFNQLSELRARVDGHQSELDRQKNDFETHMAQIKDDNERLRETADLRQEDLKAQAGIAQRAQQSYEAELVKHAEAAQSLQEIRTKYNDVKLEVSSAKAEAETAKAQLASSEESWSSTREQYENEILELKRRRDDIDRQNKILHQQMDSINSQIKQLDQKRQSNGPTSERETSNEPDSQRSQEIINYLRREKEIVDVQYELSLQESRRLRQQLEYTESQLNDVRLRLEQERTRQQGQQNHNKLAETINELNVYRESSVTLRNETRAAQAKLDEHKQKIKQLQEHLEPLQAEVLELRNRQETSSEEMNLLQQDRDRWQKRTQDILSKYDRVDPAEYQELKENLASLQSQHDENISQKQLLQERIDAFDKSLEEAKEEAAKESKKTTLDTVQEQFKRRSKDMNDKLKAAQADTQSSHEELERVKADLANTHSELAAVKHARDEALASAAQAQSQSAPAQDHNMNNGDVMDVNLEGEDEEGEAEEGEVQDDLQPQLREMTARAEQETTRASQLQEQVDQLTTKMQEQEAHIQGLQSMQDNSNQENENAQGATQSLNEQQVALQAELEELRPKIQAYETEIHGLQARLDTERSELEMLRQGSDAPQPQASSEGSISQEQFDKVQSDLADAQKELEILRQNATGSAANTQDASLPGNKDTDLSKSIRDQLEADFTLRQTEMEQKSKERIEGMKKQLNDKLREAREKAKEALRGEHQQEMTDIRQEHETEIARLKSQHEREVNLARESLEQQVTKLEAQLAGGTTQSQLTGEGEASTIQNGFPTDSDQVKDFVSNNATVKAIVTRNIQEKVKAEKEKFDQQLTDETATLRNQISELQGRVEKAKQDATTLAEKKSQMKLNMTEKKKNDLQVKVEYVQRAASETPEKPVVEVWNVAKDTKPPTAGKQSIQVQTPAAAAVSAAKVPPTPTQNNVNAQTPNTATPTNVSILSPIDLASLRHQIGKTSLDQNDTFGQLSDSNLCNRPVPPRPRNFISGGGRSPPSTGRGSSDLGFLNESEALVMQNKNRIPHSPPLYSLPRKPFYLNFTQASPTSNSEMVVNSSDAPQQAPAPQKHTSEQAAPANKPNALQAAAPLSQVSARNASTPAQTNLPRPGSAAGGGSQNTIRGGAARRFSNPTVTHAQLQLQQQPADPKATPAAPQNKRATPPAQSGIPRGGGSALPRGGRGGGTRGRGAMNPQAGNFQPGGGVKRPAEDGAGRGGADAKRSRGA